MRHLACIFLTLLAVSPAFPQAANVQINRENKTISVSADHTIPVDPEIAILRFGYRNTSPQKDTAYRDNVKVAGEILKALQDAGISDEVISTDSLQLERQEQSENKLVKPELLQFEAYQAWKVRVASKEAQSIIEIAAKAGANDVSNPEWIVSDPVALEAQAYGAALAKARKIAEQMANGLGAQLGDLVYATNSLGLAYVRLNASMAEQNLIEGRPVRRPEPVLRILPQKVERRVQVVAVFAVK